MSETPERDHYRIQYPVPERPHLRVKRDSFIVIDVSERGLRIEVDPKQMPIGMLFRGQLHFVSGNQTSVGGKIIRAAEGYVVALLDEWVPLTIIMEEQRWLIGRYQTLDVGEKAKRDEGSGE